MKLYECRDCGSAGAADDDAKACPNCGGEHEFYVGPPGGRWTGNLRWLRVGTRDVLEQEWLTSDGVRQWCGVATIDEDAAG